MRPVKLLASVLFGALPFAATASLAVPLSLSAESINASDLTPKGVSDAADGVPDPMIVRLQILLDRAGASPGVIDGFNGDNVRKAVSAFELMNGLPEDGKLGADVIAKLQTDSPVVRSYTITESDVSDLVPEIPKDYAEMAKLKFLGYTSVTEELGERFHMDEDLVKSLNPQAKFTAGEKIFVADFGDDKTGKVVKIEADKTTRQLRGYDASGTLLVAQLLRRRGGQERSPAMWAGPPLCFRGSRALAAICEGLAGILPDKGKLDPAGLH